MIGGHVPNTDTRTMGLAINGGPPAVPTPLEPYRSMGAAEAEAVADVVRSGCLSGFYGSAGPEFLGGPQVRSFEEAWANHCAVRHAVSVNSATSGLFAAMGAIGLSPGDEVIVPPTTMSASVMAPLMYGGIPVFADIEDQNFCLDVDGVSDAIGPRTRAILAVNLFGHPARLADLRALADRHGLFLIEDSAQAPMAAERGRRAGTVGHIGVFSLNYHKHIHAGEGGVCVTDDDDLAQRLQLIRNHGENLTEGRSRHGLVNLVGQNYRMTELQAAIARVQLDAIDRHVAARERVAQAFSATITTADGLLAPVVRDGCRHNFYCWVARLQTDRTGIDRTTFSAALAAEGFPHAVGYVEPLYRLPVFRERVAIGRDGWPFTLTDRTYPDGLCPVAERLHRNEIVLFEPCAWAIDDATLDRLVVALRKVLDGVGELQQETVRPGPVQVRTG